MSDGYSWRDWLRCPECGGDTDVEGITYHEFWFTCEDCGLKKRVGPL